MRAHPPLSKLHMQTGSLRYIQVHKWDWLLNRLQEGSQILFAYLHEPVSIVHTYYEQSRVCADVLTFMHTDNMHIHTYMNSYFYIDIPLNFHLSPYIITHLQTYAYLHIYTFIYSYIHVQRNCHKHLCLYNHMCTS